MSDFDNESDKKGQIQTLSRPKIKTRKPPLYKVLILNDDYTPMDFVVSRT